MPSSTPTRESLLEAALQLIEARGPGALRIRDVAEATGKSTMGVYTHFGSKQGLLEQLYLHGFGRLEDRITGASPTTDGRQGLLALALAYRGFAVENEALYGLMFERAAPDFIPSDDSRLAGATTFELLTQSIVRWRPELTDPAHLAHLVWATMHGLVSIELMHRRWGGPIITHLQGDPEQTYATAVESLIDGLEKR